MKGNQISLILILISLFYFFGESISSLDDTNDNQVYIVYMGAKGSTSGTLRNDHAQILNTVLTRNENALVHNYKYGFSGFAARLSKNEAHSIAQQPGVVSVFPDSVRKLATTHSWDFIKSQTDVKINNIVSNSSSSSDIIIGMLDSGIWPEAPSFSDKGMGPIPSHWKGICMTSSDFNSSNCNRKIIGARYYKDDTARIDPTVRDSGGHGTHTASTAAGVTVSGASYYGVMPGIAKGGSPESRLAIYRVCGSSCLDSRILAAFDDAIHDGVDVLSVSIVNFSRNKSDVKTDSLAIGAFHAAEHNILVVCSAGNDGPGNGTLVNDVPWILTVGATTIDRNLPTNIVLGNNKVIEGIKALSISNLSKSPVYSLITGDSAKAASATFFEASSCQAGSLDKKKVQGKIVVCRRYSDFDSPVAVVLEVKDAGGIGLIHIYNNGFGTQVLSYGDFPVTIVETNDGNIILQYVNSTSNPTATILPTATVLDYKPAPMVAIFSSRGPSLISKNIIKPDIVAPGVNILASWTGKNVINVPKGEKPSAYNIMSGTSMACPHVSGLAASIKSRNPTWSASAIKSAIMTSATQINNLKAPITTEYGEPATPYDYGAGHITYNSFQPGLVYETSTIEYVNYLCYLGYNTTTIKLISLTVPKNFICPKDSSSNQISNINYPSIAISEITKRRNVNVSRTVTNIGEEDDTVYSVVVDAPKGVKVQLIPEKLHFTKSSKTLSYQAIFSSTLTSFQIDLFGSITWSNGKYSVKSPFVLTV